MAPKAPDDTSLRSQVYDWLRDALTTGRFTPGQKLSFRFIAGTLGVSLTPVREAIRRLVAEGAFEMRPSRSIRVPVRGEALPMVSSRRRTPAVSPLLSMGAAPVAVTSATKRACSRNSSFSNWK